MHSDYEKLCARLNVCNRLWEEKYDAAINGVQAQIKQKRIFWQIWIPYIPILILGFSFKDNIPLGILVFAYPLVGIAGMILRRAQVKQLRDKVDRLCLAFYQEMSAVGDQIIPLPPEYCTPEALNYMIQSMQYGKAQNLGEAMKVWDDYARHAQLVDQNNQIMNQQQTTNNLLVWNNIINANRN